MLFLQYLREQDPILLIATELALPGSHIAGFQRLLPIF